MREIDNGFLVSRYDEQQMRDHELYAKDESEAKQVMVKMMAGKA